MSEEPAEKAYQATPAATLRDQIMDCRVPKNEREWWAAREIAALELRVAELTLDLKLAGEDGDLLDFVEAHPHRASIVGGKQDGEEPKVWAVSAHQKWTLREAIRAWREQLNFK